MRRSSSERSTVPIRIMPPRSIIFAGRAIDFVKYHAMISRLRWTTATTTDQNPGIDWVQGTAIITEVNRTGGFVRDVMAYNRRFDNAVLHYLDTCYIGYAGALYRRSLHDRVGYYDDRFRAAGDTEFKNRAM